MNSPSYIFFTEIPHNATPSIEVSGCFFTLNGRFLLLKRNENKPYGGTWCLPAGKKEASELPHQTAVREVFEETGIRIQGHEIHQIGSFFIQMPQSSLVFHTFTWALDSFPELNIDPHEHIEHRWVNFHDLDSLELIIAGREVLDLCRPFLR